MNKHALDARWSLVMAGAFNLTNVTLNTCYEQAAARRPANEDAPSNLIPLGIVIGLSASITINLAQNFENIYKPPPKLTPDSPPMITDAYKKWVKDGKRSKYYTAVLFIAIAAISNFGAFALAPASVLAPLEGSQFISNYLFNLYYQTDEFKEKPCALLFGTLVVVVGVVLPVVSASDLVTRFDLEGLLCMSRRDGWNWTLLGSKLAAFICTFAYYRLHIKRAPEKRSLRKVNSAEKSEDEKVTISVSNAEVFFYAVGSALVGGYAVTNAKIISELLEMIFSDSQSSLLTEWFFWNTALNVTACFIGWVALLQRGPREYSAVSILPALQGLYIVFSSIGGGIYFEEFYYFDTRQYIAYFGGMGLICVGLVLIVPLKLPNPDNAWSELVTGPQVKSESESNNTIQRRGYIPIPVLLLKSYETPKAVKSTVDETLCPNVSTTL